MDFITDFTGYIFRFCGLQCFFACEERLEREASLHEEQCAAKVAQAQEKDQAEIKENPQRLQQVCYWCIMAHLDTYHSMSQSGHARWSATSFWSAACCRSFSAAMRL